MTPEERAEIEALGERVAAEHRAQKALHAPTRLACSGCLAPLHLRVDMEVRCENGRQVLVVDVDQLHLALAVHARQHET